ncbi:MAG: DNA-3-methyladenine glycosylase I [Ascidiaceihabitans sp.]|nr:DNA-3-methyladenine glycosylase I [Ascidiaceihabitans sp.]
MRDIQDIHAISLSRKGEAAMRDLLTPSKSATDLAQIPEDRWLAQLTKGVFQAGFNWKVIEAKWDGFEEAFKGFDVGACAFLDDEWFDSLLSNKAVVRNGTKLATVRDNAAFLMGLRDQGGAGHVIGGWPSTDFIGLLDLMKTNGARLGGTTAQYSLRFMGRDSWVMSADVIARLIAEGVIDKPPTSKGAQRAVQAAFNEWMDQSDYGLTQISRILATSL